MCIGGSPPDPPTVPERQAQKLPDNGSTAGRTDDTLKRRRAMMATVLTSPTGLGAPPSVTSSTLGG